MRFRWSTTNVLLGLLAATGAVGVVSLSPDVATWIRVLAVIGMLAVAVTLALFLWWTLARDRGRMTLFAAVQGWSFRARDEAYERRFSTFPFGSGFGGAARNALTGTYRFHTCTTFTYVIGRPAPQVYQVTLVELEADVPPFALLPEDLAASIAKFMGGQDIVLGSPDFDDRWRIVSEHEDLVRAVFGPRLRRRMERHAMRGMPIVVDAGAVLTWRAGSRGIRRLSRRLDILVDVAEAIPEDVWRRSARRSTE